MARKRDYIIGSLCVTAAYGFASAAVVSYGRSLWHSRKARGINPQSDLEARLRMHHEEHAQTQKSKLTLYANLAVANAVLAARTFDPQYPHDETQE